MKRQLKVLPLLTSEQAVQRNLDYVQGRRDGTITSLRTKFDRFNHLLLNGIELNTITTIAALSGGGKSTIAKCLADSIIELNKEHDIELYNFNFEMLAHQVIGRSISSSAEITLKKLYSVDEPLGDSDFNELLKFYETLKHRQSFFIETPDSPEAIADTIIHYWTERCKAQGKVMFAIVDHTLLIRGKQGQSEREKIDELMNLLIRAKKHISSNGGKCIFIVLSQMNRDIKSVERIKNADAHLPLTSDIFGASSVEFASDYIIISHMPSKLGITSYTSQKLPVFYDVYKNDSLIKKVPAIYFHLLKNRSGEPDKVIPIKNRLQYFDLDEIPLEDFNIYHTQFRETGQVRINVA